MQPPPKRQRGKGRKPWHDVRESMASELRAGPDNLSQLEEWPITLAKSLLQSREEDEEVQLRLATHLRSGLVCTSDFSGIDSPREAMEEALWGLQQVAGWDMDWKQMRMARTCDSGNLQTHVLTTFSKNYADQKICHFMDITERLPEVGRTWVAAATPPDRKRASRAERSAAHADIQAWVMKNRCHLFPPDATCHCCIHGGQCPVHPQLGKPNPLSTDCEDPVAFNVAGIVCVPWSAEGLFEGTAHETDVFLSIWTAERRALAERSSEHLWFAECTPRFPVKAKLADQLPDHDVLWLETGPQLFGWPVKRNRLLMTGVNRKQMLYLGPRGAELEEDFKRRFYRGMVMAGDVFFNAPGHEVIAEYVEIARGRKFNVGHDDLEKLDSESVMEMVLPPHGNRKIKAHKSRLQEIASDLRPGDAEPTYIFDAEQSVTGKGSSVGSEWPSQLTHGSIIHIKSNNYMRLAIGMEHFNSMGFTVWPSGRLSKPSSGLMNVLKDLKHRQKKLLAGNAMHLVTQAAWQLYILGHCVRVAAPCVQRPLSHVGRRGSWLHLEDEEEEQDIE